MFRKTTYFLAVMCFFFAGFVLAQETSDSVGKLVADIDGRDSGNAGRIPLILIHGFTGSDDLTFGNIDGTTTAEKAYFAEWIDYFYTENLDDHYKLFRYHYKSNELTVPDIAEGLRIDLDSFINGGKIDDVWFVLVGHSMGGLVSRAYMEEQTHTNGNFSGVKGGERVWDLITLATPHHGSQAANDDAREPGAGWDSLLDFIDTIFWEGGSITVNDPNRTDLKWDNYNNLSAKYETEKNVWLGNLNDSSQYLNKITAFYGDVEDASYPLRDLWQALNSKDSNYLQ